MAMNLRSKNTKSLSGTSDVTRGESNVINATPNPPTVAADSPPQDNQAEVTQNRLAQIAQVQDGWRKMVYAEFRMGACVAWDSFREDFKKIEWSRKYLHEGGNTGNFTYKTSIILVVLYQNYYYCAHISVYEYIFWLYVKSLINFITISINREMLFKNCGQCPTKMLLKQVSV